MTKGGTYASPHSMATEVDPTCFDPLGVDPQQARDVARWRRAERKRLAGLRESLGQARRAQLSARIGKHLERVLSERGVMRECVLSVFARVAGLLWIAAFGGFAVVYGALLLRLSAAKRF